MILTKNFICLNLVPTLKCVSIFVKLGTQNKSNMLIMNMLIRIDDLVTKLQIWADLVPKLKCTPIFMKLGAQRIY